MRKMSPHVLHPQPVDEKLGQLEHRRALAEREVHLAAQTLEQAHRRTARLREERVVETGDEKAYPHR
jgi:hypothetical protein